MRQLSSSLFSLACLAYLGAQLTACCVTPGVSPRPDGGELPDTGMTDGGRDGGPGDGGPEDTGPLAKLPTNGGSLAVTRGQSVAIVLSRSIGRPPGTEVNVEKHLLDDSSPPTLSFANSYLLRDATQVIVGADDNSAYAAGRDPTTNQPVALKFTNLRMGLQLTPNGSGTVGGEPRGVALSPSGALLFVANWSDGTVTVLQTSDMSVRGIVNLNRPLAASGVFGEPGVALNRPGLAHPWGVAVTDDGDGNDDNETVYVTEYFSQARVTGVPTDDSAFDLGRQGVIYYFNVAARVVGPVITIAPRAVSEPALVNSNDRTTFCFPNLLSFTTLHRAAGDDTAPERLFVVGTCASPRGPIGPRNDPVSALPINEQNFKTVVHPAVFVVNTQTNLEDPAGGALLTRELQKLYDDTSTPDDDNRRMPLVPTELAFEPGSDVAYLTAYGADAVFRLEWASDGTFSRVGTPQRRYIDLGANLPSGGAPGRLPYGIIVAPKANRAYVANEHSRNLSILELPSETISATPGLRNVAVSGTEADINDGRRFFVTGLGRWSHRGQAWTSCEACHPRGLSDGVTWFLNRGPRQTIPLDASVRRGGVSQRLFGWSASADEVHDYEMFTRDLSGGVGAIVHRTSTEGGPLITNRITFDLSPAPAGGVSTTTRQDWLNGTSVGMMPQGSVSPRSILSDWDRIQAYFASGNIHTPRPPSNVVQADAQAGRSLFLSSNCHGCHSSEQWTLSRRFYTPAETLNNPITGQLVTETYPADPMFPAALNPPSAGAGRSAKFRVFDPANDQMNCALRAVGTFPAAVNADRTGVGPTDVRLREVRAATSTATEMNVLAQGADGYNIPSLLGVHAGAPYFHAGNARTLEELFSDTFSVHANALGTVTFPGPGDRNVAVRTLIAYLLTISDNTTLVQPPQQSTLGYQVQLCPQVFPR